MKRSLTIFIAVSADEKKDSIHQCLINNAQQDILPKKLVKLVHAKRECILFYGIWLTPREHRSGSVDSLPWRYLILILVYPMGYRIPIHLKEVIKSM